MKIAPHTDKISKGKVHFAPQFTSQLTNNAGSFVEDSHGLHKEMEFILCKNEKSASKYKAEILK